MIKTLLATAGLGAALIAPASAMTVDHLTTTASVEKVAWICDPFGCFWRPGPRVFFGGPVWGPGFYGGRRFYGGPRFYGGYRGGFRRW